MSNKKMIRLGIVGYGNLGKGVEQAIGQNSDMTLVAVFSRRDPQNLKILTPSAVVESMDKILNYKDKIDVLVLCGGSATDLPAQTPLLAKHFNVVDSFDTHAKIPRHFADVDEALKASGKVGAIAVGWDPGIFSINRLYGQAVLPKGQDYTFWGPGVSQGHSDALRRIDGVKMAVQHTMPIETALQQVRDGKNPSLVTRQKHNRVCFVVAHDNANLKAIESEIVNMPNYFADYDTVVNFVSEKDFLKNHTSMPHGGFVFRTGSTADGSDHVMEFSLKLASNPSFTSSILTAYARAIARLSHEGVVGCLTVLDIAPTYLSQKSSAELYKELL